MSADNKKTLIVIAGPTAIGKTELAIKLANFFSTEIVSADSRQFFREMSIGTAKPTPAELDRAVHHFVDFLPAEQFFSAGDFEKAALATIQDIFTRADTAILVGGSGLYIQAVTEGFDEFPNVPASIREALNEALDANGIEPLANELRELDPVYAQTADLSNPQRVIRALEVCRFSGRPYSSFKTGISKKRPFKVIKIGLTTDREKLYERINRRVDAMIAEGLIEEARGLKDKQHLNALQTVGYSELFTHFDDKSSLEEAIGLIKQNTRRYAKRQLTWFKKDPEMKWFEAEDEEGVIDYIKDELKK
ncbi:MAG: tRNA (adenosine(37)-N6)-dimethylallyltransferase MiaA [Bacteroidota bacterium]